MRRVVRVVISPYSTDRMIWVSLRARTSAYTPTFQVTRYPCSSDPSWSETDSIEIAGIT
jgi:hypothetical protein